MQCFNHHETAAVGMCKHCNKGLCAACATDLDFGLACRDKHEEQVQALQTMFTKASHLQSVNRSNKYLTPAFLIVMGLLFFGWAFVESHSVINFTGAMGVVFLLYGVSMLGAVRKAYAQPKA
jgi:hypothetical protein